MASNDKRGLCSRAPRLSRHQSIHQQSKCKEAIMTLSSNSIRKITGLGCLLSVLPVALWAKDFWEEKPFTSWSQKEALRILSDSPWGKIQHITLPSSEWDLGGVTTPSGNVPPPISSPQGGAVGRTGDVQGDPSSGRNAPGARVPGAYGEEPGSVTRSVPFQVTWYSSAKVSPGHRQTWATGGRCFHRANQFLCPTTGRKLHHRRLRPVDEAIRADHS